MNQPDNKVPYGLLSKEEQAQFCDEALDKGLYEVFHGDTWAPATTHHFPKAYAHRLIIKDDEWYWADDGEIWAGAVLGESLRPEAIECYDTLRLAIPAEIQAARPKVESLEDRVKDEYGDYEVVMLEWKSDVLVMDSGGRAGNNHVMAQSMKGFAGYVYYAHPFTIKPMPIMRDGERYIQPIALLFTKDNK